MKFSAAEVCIWAGSGVVVWGMIATTGGVVWDIALLVLHGVFCAGMGVFWMYMGYDHRQFMAEHGTQEVTKEEWKTIRGR